MGYTHHYDLIKDGDNPKEEPTPIVRPVVTSWRNFVICNLLAAAIGAGAMFLVMSSSLPTKSGSVVANSPANNPASTAVTSAAAVAVATTTTSAVHLALATPKIEHVEGNIESTPDGHGTILDCGGNPEEARAKGCVYDVMMQDWVPEPCYDSILTERYLAENKWIWYADGNGETTMSDEVMRKGEHGVAWMSTSYHKAHCVFSWLKIIRALRNGRGISQELLSYDHVLHCAHGALKENSDDENLSVSAPTNYARCALYETWKQDPIPDKHDSTA